MSVRTLEHIVVSDDPSWRFNTLQYNNTGHRILVDFLSRYASSDYALDASARKVFNGWIRRAKDKHPENHTYSAGLSTRSRSTKISPNLSSGSFRKDTRTYSATHMSFVGTAKRSARAPDSAPPVESNGPPSLST